MRLSFKEHIPSRKGMIVTCAVQVNAYNFVYRNNFAGESARCMRLFDFGRMPSLRKAGLVVIDG